MKQPRCRQCGKFISHTSEELGYCPACQEEKKLKFLQTMNYMKFQVRSSIHSVLQELFTEESILESWARCSEPTVMMS